MTHIVWILAAGLLGFLITAVAAGVFKLSRSWLLVPYIGLAGAFLVVYFGWAQVDLARELTQGWVWGLLGAAVVSVIAVRNVARQPASVTPEGAELGIQVLWWGVVYGSLDGLLLSVMPVIATREAFGAVLWGDTWYGQAAMGLMAVIASAYVTAAYHVGYPEFRNKTVIWPLWGNTVMTVAMLITGNPLAAIVSHAAMHIAAVLHGTEATVQLPPHYERAA